MSDAGASRWSQRVRILLVCGLAMVPAAGAIHAQWGSAAPVQPAALEAGTLDLLVDGELAGPGGTIARGWSAADLLPGDFTSFSMQVGNGASAPFTYQLAVAGTSWTYTDAAVSVQPFSGTPIADGGCSGGSIGANRTLSATGQAAGPLFEARQLAAGASEPVCVRIGLATSAPSTNQGSSGSFVFTLTATQVNPNP